MRQKCCSPSVSKKPREVKNIHPVFWFCFQENRSYSDKCRKSSRWNFHAIDRLISFKSIVSTVASPRKNGGEKNDAVKNKNTDVSASRFNPLRLHWGSMPSRCIKYINDPCACRHGGGLFENFSHLISRLRSTKILATNFKTNKFTRLSIFWAVIQLLYPLLQHTLCILRRYF